MNTEELFSAGRVCESEELQLKDQKEQVPQKQTHIYIHLSVGLDTARV